MDANQQGFSFEVTAENFCALVSREFPELAGELHEDAGLLHLQMADVRRFLEGAASREDLATIGKGLRLIDSALEKGSPDVQNAVYVSFLEHIYPDQEDHAKIYQEFSPALKKGWKEINDYLDELFRQGEQRK